MVIIKINFKKLSFFKRNQTNITGYKTKAMGSVNMVIPRHRPVLIQDNFFLSDSLRIKNKVKERKNRNIMVGDNFVQW